MSLDSANFWFNVSNIVLLIGAVTVAAGTWGVYKAGQIKERFADERISANEAETAKARAESDVAKEAASQANEHAIKLALELENAKNTAKQIDSNLLREQRLTAVERSRLKRVERAVLPRSLFIDWKLLTDEIKNLGLEKIHFVITDDNDFETNDFKLHLMLAFQGAGVRVDVSVVSVSDFKLLGSSSTGLDLVTYDEKGNALGQMLWQKFRLCGGSMGIFPAINPDVPRDVNWLVIDHNNWAMSPPDGQDGEGLDEHGRPVPPP